MIRRPLPHLAASALAVALSTTVALSATSASAAPLPSAPAAGRGTAATTPDLTGAKAKCTQAIDLRTAKLDALSASLGAAQQVTDAHRDTQQGALTDARSGLVALRAEIDADSDAASLKAHCESAITDYRVFALRAPQTAYIIAGDSQAAAAARMNDALPKITKAIDALEASGKDMSAARTALDDLQAKLADATPKAATIADGAIGFGPADYNANKQVLAPTHTTVLAVRADLAAARTDLRTIAQAIKAAKAG